ncbi:hypothetical protein ACQ4PT_054908 [Festuca glaucescens]
MSFVVARMVKKRKAVDCPAEDDSWPARKRVRNRASPYGVVKLYPFLSKDQKAVVATMELDSLLDVKCSFLHSRLISWFSGLYDKHTREFVIPGRGRIPLNELLVYRTLGLPLGSELVIYVVNSNVEDVLGPSLFPQDGSTPTRTRVFQIRKDMVAADDAFKQIWLMYVVSTLIVPTTSINVRNRCYPVMLMYVDSIDISGLNLNLPQGRYVVNILSKEDIETVLLADLLNDGKSYGKLKLKREFGVNYTLFGGAQGFQKWMDTCSDPSCPVEQKTQVANLVGSFVSGMAGLLGSLVQGWTSMHGDGGGVTPSNFGDVADNFLTGLVASSGSAERVSRDSMSRMKSGYTTRAAAAKAHTVPLDGLLPEDNTFLDDDSETDCSWHSESGSDDDVEKYVVAPRKRNQVKTRVSVGGKDPTVSPTAPIAHALVKPAAISQNVDMEDTIVPELRGCPNIPAADFENRPDLSSDIPVSMNDSSTMDSTFVQEPSAPSDIPAAGHGSDVIEDNVVARSGDITRNAQAPDEIMNVSDAADLAEAPVLCAMKTGKGKKKLQPLRVKDNEIKSIVAGVLGITKDMLRSSMSTRLDWADDARKATPKRKVIKKVKFAADLKPTRASPRLAKQHASSCVRNVEATLTSVIDIDLVSEGMAPICVEGVDGNDDIRAEVHGASDASNSIGTETSKNVDNISVVEPDVNVSAYGPAAFVPATSPLLNLDPPVWNFTSQSPVCCDVPSVDKEAADPSPNVPIDGTSASTDTPFDATDVPSVDKEVADHLPNVPIEGTCASKDTPLYATLIDEHGMDDIHEGIPIFPIAGNFPLNKEHAPVDYFAEFEGNDPVPLAWAANTPTGSKMSSNGKSDVIFFDDLLAEKVGVQGVQIHKENKTYCNNINAVVQGQGFYISSQCGLQRIGFPVLQNIGTAKDPLGHWYVMSLNFDAKRLNCGIFMLKFLELWYGSVVPAITLDQIPAVQKTSKNVDNIPVVEPDVNVSVYGPATFVPATSPLLNLDPPVWNFTSQSPVCCDVPSVDKEAADPSPNVPIDGTSASTDTPFDATDVPSVDKEVADHLPNVPIEGTCASKDTPLYATLIDEHGTDDIHEGIPIFPIAGNFPLNKEHAPVDYFSEFEGNDTVPSAWAANTPTGSKMSSNGKSDVISFDNLLAEKVGVQGVQIHKENKTYCNNINAIVQGQGFYISSQCGLQRIGFPVLQNIGTAKDPLGHWYVMSLNFDAKRLNCGIIMLKFHELWYGSVVPAISLDQIPAVRKALVLPRDTPLYATLIDEHGTDDIHEGIPIFPIAGNFPLNKEHAPVDYFAEFEGNDPVPSAWAANTPTGSKMSSNGKSDVISFDNLLAEKVGVQGVQIHKENKTYCNNINAVVQDVCDLSTPAVAAPVICASGSTPRTRLRRGRNIGTAKDPLGHWYVMSLNFDAKRLNCGIFMLKFLELWYGSVVPAISLDQIPAVRKVLTASWLEHPGNTLCNWRSLLVNNMF